MQHEPQHANVRDAQQALLDGKARLFEREAIVAPCHESEGIPVLVPALTRRKNAL